MSVPAPAFAVEPEIDLQAAQSAVAARLGSAQADNVNARLRALHGQAPCDRFDVGANIRWERAPGASNERAAPQATPKLADAFKRTRCDGAFALWARGDLDFGFLRARTAGDRGELRTPATTIGADLRVLDRAVIGAAVGYGMQSAPTDAVGSEARARTQSVSVHSTFAPMPFVDINALVGTGALSVEADRTQPGPLDLAFTDRAGSQGFGSLSVSANLAGSRMRITPFARYDQVRTRLDAFSERDSTALVTGSACATEDAVTFGLQAAFRLLFTAVSIEPALRIEQRRVRSGGDYESAAPDSMTGFTSRQTLDSDESFGASVRVPVRFARKTSIAFEYRYNSSTDVARTESLRALLQTPF